MSAFLAPGCRDGLSSRPGGSAPAGQVQIRVDKFDFDAEVEGLRAHVGKIKDVSGSWQLLDVETAHILAKSRQE